MRIRSIHLVIGLVIPLNLFALGLGEIRVYSHLNEPFRAEIPLIDAASVRLSNIKAEIGTSEEFARVGLTRDEVLSLLQLKVKRNKEGRLVVALSSTERIQTPYLEILVDLAWPDGELYRAFTVLLDPPHYPLNQENGTLKRALPFEQMKQGEKTWFNSSSEDVKEKPLEQRSSSTYGPTLVDERIWQIAKRYQLDKLTLPQVVLAIVGQNPDAFQEGNLNGLKAASHLIIPSFDDMLKVPVNLGAQEIEVHDIAWRTHSQINHVLAPPYMQGTQEMTSLIPAMPAFNQAEIPAAVKVELKPASASVVTTTHEKEEKPTPDATVALTERMKKLEQSLKLKEQENRALNQKITMLEKQRAQNKQVSVPDESTEPSNYLWLYLLLLAGVLGGYLVWKKRSKPSTIPQATQTPLSTSAIPEHQPQPNATMTQEATSSAEANQPIETEEMSNLPPEKEAVEVAHAEEHEAIAMVSDEKSSTDDEGAETPPEAIDSTTHANSENLDQPSPPDDEPEPNPPQETNQASTPAPSMPEDEKISNEPQSMEEDLASFKFEETSPTDTPVSPVNKDKKTKPTAPQTPMAKEPELVKSPEALETLLQLAKTYISRGDLQAAKRGLEEVLVYGNHKQQEEATLLLEQIEGMK